MTKRKPKHGVPYGRWFKYPLAMRIYEWKNRWYFFTKPKLKAKLKRFFGSK